MESRTTFRDKETEKSHRCPIMKWDCPETVLSSLRECLYVWVQAIMQDYLCVNFKEYGYMNYLNPLVVNLFNHKKTLNKSHVNIQWYVLYFNDNMMTSSNGNIFRVTGPLWGEFTGHRWTHFRDPLDSPIHLPDPDFVITASADNLAPNVSRPLTGNVLTTKINMITWNFLVTTDF